MQFWLSRLSAVVVFVFVCAGYQPALARCAPRPLDILLTNDDGYDRPGIRALRDALEKAGHHVVIAGPEGNYSGASVSITRGEIAIRKVADGVYAISGSPATTVILGMQMLYATHAPDLVVSGINEGANLGTNIIASGTVGAAIAAAVLAQSSVPAIAVSANLPERDALSKTNRKHFNRVAKFVASAIAALSAEACGKPLLPARTILNFNYPAQVATEIRVTRPAANTNVRLAYEEKNAGSYSLTALWSSPDVVPDPTLDVGAVASGFISVSALGANYAVAPEDSARLLLHLKP